jgi:ABC-type transport system substrate-binding protein
VIVVSPSGYGVFTGYPQSSVSLDWSITETLFIPGGGVGTDIAMPWLAESWEVAEDFTKVTIKIKEGVEFHGGFGEMTAEDVAWSFNQRLEPDSISGLTAYYRAQYEPMEVVDTYSFDLIFKGGRYRPLWNQEQFNHFSKALPVNSKRAFDEKGEAWMTDNLIGTGGYRIVKHLPNELLSLEAVENHHFRTPPMKFVDILEIPGETTRQAMLKTGAADAGEISLPFVRSYTSDGFKLSDAGKDGMLGIQFTGNYWEEHDYQCSIGISSSFCPDLAEGETLLVEVPRPGYDVSLAWVGEYGNDESMKQARKVRMALTMAIDKWAINDTLLDGLGRVIHVGTFSPRSPYWDSKWEVPFDSQTAESMLDDAGWPLKDGKRFEINIRCHAHAGGPQGTCGEMMDAIGGMWDSIGVKTRVEKMEVAANRPTAVDRSANYVWLNACGGTDPKDATPWDWSRGAVMSTLSRGGFSCGFESPFIAESFWKASVETDYDKRVELSTALANYYYDNALYMGVVVVPEPMVWNPKSFSSWDMRASISVSPLQSIDMIVPVR